MSLNNLSKLEERIDNVNDIQIMNKLLSIYVDIYDEMIETSTMTKDYDNKGKNIHNFETQSYDDEGPEFIESDEDLEFIENDDDSFLKRRDKGKSPL